MPDLNPSQVITNAEAYAASTDDPMFKDLIPDAATQAFFSNATSTAGSTLNLLQTLGAAALRQNARVPDQNLLQTYPAPASSYDQQSNEFSYGATLRFESDKQNGTIYSLSDEIIDQFLSDGEFLSLSTQQPVDFLLSKPTRVALSVVCGLGLNGSPIDYVVTNQDGSPVAAVSESFVYTRYENRGAGQTQFENAITLLLPAGNYRFNPVINGGAGASEARTVRVATSYSGMVLQAGYSFHSGPYVLEDSTDRIIVGSELGTNKRLVRINGDTPVEVLPEVAQDTQERYHASIAVAKLGPTFLVAGTDHNKQLFAQSAPTVADLAGGSTRIGDLDAAYTYTRLTSNHNNTKALIFSRAGTGSTTQGLHLLTIDPSTLNTDRIDRVGQGSLKYPVQLEALGSNLMGALWQQRGSGQIWHRPNGAVFDDSIGTTGQWYNFAGELLGGATATDGTTTNPRISTAQLSQDYANGGVSLLPELDDKQVYLPGPGGLKVGAWTATDKRIQGAFLFTQTLDPSPTKKSATNIGICVFDGASKIVALTDLDGFDPLGVAPTNGYRGPSLCWWDGEDVLVAYAHRGERDKEYTFSTSKTNLYYDLTGNTVRIYRLPNALSYNNADDLIAAIEQVDEFSSAQLGIGTDNKGQSLQVYNFQKLDGNRLAIQVGVNQIDTSQSQGAIKIITYNTSNTNFQKQGRVLPEAVTNGYIFKLTEQQASLPTPYVPGRYSYNASSSTWNYVDTSPPSVASYNKTANFNGIDTTLIPVDFSQIFTPDLTSAFSIKATVQGGIQEGNRILSWGQDATDDSMIDFGFEDGTGKVRLFWRNDARVQQLTAVSNAVVLDDSPHDVEIIFNGTDEVEILIDGNSDSVHSISPNGTYTFQHFCIGALWRNERMSYFEGQISNIEIRDQGTLVHAWALNEGSSVILLDTGSNAARLRAIYTLSSFWT